MHNIFCHFLDRDGDIRRINYANWFTATFSSREFDGDELYFYYFLLYCSDLNVPVRRKYLETWSVTELRKLLASEKVKVNGCESINIEEPVGFEEVYKVTQQVLLDDFDVLMTLESNIEDFKVACSEFMNSRKSDRIVSVLSKTFNLLQSTNNADEAGEYCLNELSYVNEVYSDDILEDFDSSSASEDKLEFITDYGIEAIDSDSHGIYTTQLVDVEAQPGTGKTRFSVGTASYRAAVRYHKNVLFLALEQSEAEVRAMYISRHVYEMFNVQINDELIYKGLVPEEYKQMVEAARIDLFESGKYGKIIIKSTALIYEKLNRTLLNYDKLLGPFDLIVVDYVGLIESMPAKYARVLEDYKVISESLRKFKRFARTYRKAVLSVSQFNDAGIKAGKADKEITTDMAQGGIAVYRHTDYNIAISMTAEMKARGQRRFQQPKVRSTTGFGTFICNVWPGVCYFEQSKQVVA